MAVIMIMSIPMMMVVAMIVIVCLRTGGVLWNLSTSWLAIMTTAWLTFDHPKGKITCQQPHLAMQRHRHLKICQYGACEIAERAPEEHCVMSYSNVHICKV